MSFHRNFYILCDKFFQGFFKKTFRYYFQKLFSLASKFISDVLLKVFQKSHSKNLHSLRIPSQTLAKNLPKMHSKNFLRIPQGLLVLLQKFLFSFKNSFDDSPEIPSFFFVFSPKIFPRINF